jgi:hypothetical protein
MSAGVGSHSPAFTFALTCSGFVAPAITDATAGIAARPPIATSSNDTPRSRANRSSCSSRSLPPPAPPLFPPPPAPVLAGEQAARERKERQHPDSEPLAGRQDLVLDLTLDERVVVLRRHEADEPPLARNAVRVFDLLRREVGRADVPHRSLLDELVQCSQRLRYRGLRIGLVHLVHVDRVRAQAAQRPLGRPANVVARAARQVRAAVHRLAELRRDHDAVEAAGERLSDVLLARPLRVDVRGVDQRDALVECSLDDGARFLEVTAGAEVVRSEADDRDLRSALAECPCAHGATLPVGQRPTRRYCYYLVSPTRRGRVRRNRAGPTRGRRSG